MAEVEEYEEGVDSDLGGPARRSSSGLLSGRRVATIVVALVGASAITAGYLLWGPSSTPKPVDPAALLEKKKEEAREKAKNAKYDVIFGQLTSDKASDVLQELSRADISFRTVQNGKNFQISVPEDRMEEAKMLLAAKGVPSGTAQGYELLDSGQTLGVTEFDKRVRYVRAIEGEIEKSIKQIEVVQNCKVKVVLPEQRLFAVTQPPVTAAIILIPIAGGKLTDGIVFSIIQYVANSVENLQPENVTVVDSRGRNLSDGIFERMAARESGSGGAESSIEPSRNSIEDVAAPENARPIVPDFQQVDQWYQAKEKYEQTLIERATKQLVGVLPLGSFKIALTTDLGPLQNGEIVDIKRITTSIVVDNNREDIDLNDDTKKQIFNTLAASVGYVRGRDVIILNRADFSIMTPEERRKLEAIMSAKKNMKYWLLGAAAVASMGLFTLGTIRLLRRRQRATPSEPINLMGSDSTRSTDFQDLQSEIDRERRFDQVRDVAATDPEILAKIMEDWITADSGRAA